MKFERIKKDKWIDWIDNLFVKTSFFLKKKSQYTYLATSLASSTCELPVKIFIELEDIAT